MVWIRSPSGKAWITSHPCVQAWLDKLSKERTRDTYGHNLYIFCKALGKSPEELIELRRTHATGWNIVELLENFLLHGKFRDERKGHNGEVREVGQTSSDHRKSIYTSIRSFFDLTHGDNGPLSLPLDKAFKIRESDERRSPTRYITLDQANAIIGALKEPYRTLFTISKYSGMGNNELLYLNEFWPTIRKQLTEGVDPIRVDYGRRKSNVNPFFTLIPSKLLSPYVDVRETPFLSLKITKGEKAERKPITATDLFVAWKGARKRAGIREPVKGHMLRDLFTTLAFKVGMRHETSNFLTGHVVDRNEYLQIIREPSTVIREWEKLRNYLDSGVDDETKELMVKQSLEVQQLRKELNEIKANDLKMQIIAAEGEVKSGLPDLLEQGEITEEEYKTRMANVQEEIKKLREELKALGA